MRLAGTLRALGCVTALATACGRGSEAPEPAVSFSDTTSLDSDPGSGAGFLDPNLATAAALTALPGMSDSITLAVIAGRPYANMAAVDRVLARHLSEQWRDSVYTSLWLRLDLNTASSDEIQLIPGVDDRLRHELEEYRPYDGVESFRRDIGGQAGAEEAARLERYITIR